MKIIIISWLTCGVINLLFQALVVETKTPFFWWLGRILLSAYSHEELEKLRAKGLSRAALQVILLGPIGIFGMLYILYWYYNSDT